MRAILLVIDSAIEHLPMVGMAVKGICSEAAPNGEDAYLLELCVVEAVSNVIRHAYGSHPGRSVEVAVEAASDRLAFRIRDRGEAMDPELLQRPPLTAPESRDDLPEGGMGLAIIRDVMDEVSYASFGGVNELVMIKHLASSGG